VIGALTTFIDQHSQLALLLVFVLLFLESFGLPLPGETALIACGVLASQGVLAIGWVIVVAVAAAILGDNVGYWVARKGGRKLLTRYPPTRVLPRQPQHEFRTSVGVDGRPGRRCGYVHLRATNSRCQRSNVAGLTNAERRHVCRDRTWPSAASSARSTCVSCGRATWRSSTPNWWRSSRISISFSRSDRARGHFPNEQAALKCLYLTVRSLDPTGRGRQRWSNRWKPALNAFAVTFEGRIEIND
jgi:hypothetical protein